jgi:two-component system sensor histidine kinase DesK
MSSTRRWRLLPDDRFLGWTPFIWLVYLPTLFVTPVIRRDPPWVWIATAVVCVIFLPLYFRGYWARGRERYYVIAAISVLGAITAPINNSAFALLIYAASFAGTVQPTRRALWILVLLTAVILAEWQLFDLHPFGWAWAVMFVWIVGGVNTHFSTVRRSDVVLRQAREEIEHLAKVAERERIARDLHDVLGHTLSLITLKSALASRLAEREPQRAAAEIRDVERISREALAEVRAAVAGYRDAGIAHEIQNARQMLEAGGITAAIEVGSVPLSPAEEAVLALAIREAVTNVVRHSGATVCTVRLAQPGQSRVLEISDDGRWKGAPAGSGLSGMRERIEATGGTLELHSGRGTRLVITLPEAGESRRLPANVSNVA